VTPADYAADFEVFWETIEQQYAYPGTRGADWACVQRELGPLAAATPDDAAFLQVLERALEALAEPHANLNRNLPSSFRLVPSGLDVWAQWEGGEARIVQVRPGSGAEKAGVVPGEVVLTVGGQPVAEVVAARLGPCTDPSDPEARDWALRSALAGRHDTERVWTLQRPAGVHEVRPDLPTEPLPAVQSHQTEDGLGWIAVHDLGDRATVRAFDRALRELRDTPGLVLDLSDTAAGGSTSVAEPILGRLVQERAPYQKGEVHTGGSWVREVSPRKRPYRGAVVVLVSHWTASMGEGMAMGLDGLGRATVVGSPMAGLRGAVITHVLPSTGLPYTFPFERLMHVDGTPRERWLPEVLLPPQSRAEDEAAALSTLRGLLSTGAGLSTGTGP
jgi:C-terminal processing protease CtpA/Prc